MQLTASQTLVMILAIMAGTMITRFLPFIAFPENRKIPPFINYLGRVLPPTMIGLLVVYCLRGIAWTNRPYGIPEFISILLIIVVHRRKSNTLLSIGGGTLCYMIMLRILA